MCSNTSGGDDEGDHHNHNHQHIFHHGINCSSSNSDNCSGYFNSTLMEKPQKTPKRGPGVAELEKILRDEEKRSGFEQNYNNDEPHYSLLSFIPPQPPPPLWNNNVDTTSLTHHVERFDNVVQNKPFDHNLPRLANGISLPTISPSPSSSFMPNKHFYQSNQHYSKINHGIAVPASSSSSIGLSPGQILEHPSTQTSNQFFYPSILPEDHQKLQIGNKKRLVPFSVNNYLPSLSVQYQVPSSLPHVQIPDNSSLNNLCKIYKLHLSNLQSSTMPREPQNNGIVKPINFQNYCTTESGVPDNGAHLNRFVPPNVVCQPLMHTFLEQLPKNHDDRPLFRRCMVEANSKGESETGGSDREKPFHFHSFVQIKEQGTKEKPICMDKEEDESVGEDGIDLKLKL